MSDSTWRDAADSGPPFRGTDRYRLVRPLRSGGMGAVYEVEDRETGAHLALKTMRSADPARLLRFKQEFRVIAELRHPNLVTPRDLAREGALWFFTMELIQGQDLVQLLLPEDMGDTEDSTPDTLGDLQLPSVLRASDCDGPPLRRPGPVACELEALEAVIGQLADALEFLHSHGIVHGDLKPSNVMVDVAGQVRVLDFGLSIRIADPLAASMVGVVSGTLPYMAPERCLGESCTPASDLYALGCLVFQLLTGELPMRGSPAEIVRRRQREPPPRVESYVTGVPAEWAALCRGLMAIDPAARPGLDAVRRLAAGSRAVARPVASVFVGRTRETAAIRSALARALASRKQLITVSGPSGIGKTTLARMTVPWARQSGFLCFEGRCFDRERVPYLVLDRVVDDVVLAVREWPAERRAKVLPLLRPLLPMFPTIEALTGPPREEEAGRGRERARLAIDSFAMLLDVFQELAPILLVLDDLQWADDGSLDLLAAALEGATGRIAVLGLIRSDCVTDARALQKLERFSMRSEGGLALALGRLGTEEAAELLSTVAGTKLSPEGALALARQTDGHPFLTSRLAEYLAAGATAAKGVTASAEGATVEVGADTSPNVESLLDAMITTLGDSAEEVLALTVTAGGELSTSTLRAASGLGATELDDALADLAALRFVATTRAPETSVRHVGLYHERIGEAASARLSPERSRALHRRLAETLEATGEDAEQLYRHWTGAGDLERRRRYAALAAAQAESRLAFVRAAELFSVTLEDTAPDAATPQSAACWERIGTLFEYGGRPNEAVDAFGRALRCWQVVSADHPDRRASLLRVVGQLGESLTAVGRVREGASACAEGLALLDLSLTRGALKQIGVILWLGLRLLALDLVPERLLPLRRTSQGAMERVRRLDQIGRALMPLWWMPAAELSLRAELLARRLDAKEAVVRSLFLRVVRKALSFRLSGRRIRQCQELLDQGDRLAAEGQDVDGLALMRQARSFLWLNVDPVRAVRSVETGLSLLEQAGKVDGRDAEFARGFRIVGLVTTGRYQAALDAIARERARVHVSVQLLREAALQEVWILASCGRVEEAAQCLEAAEVDLADVPPCRVTALLTLVRWRIWLARASFEEILGQRSVLLGRPDPLGASLTPNEVSVATWVAIEAAAGAAATGTLSARDRRWALHRAGRLARTERRDLAGLGDRVAALIHHHSGSPRRAARDLRRCLERSRDNDQPYHRWLCLEASRTLGRMTVDESEEAADLLEHGGFRL